MQGTSAVFRWSQASCLAWLHLRHQSEPIKFGRRDSSSQVSVGTRLPSRSRCPSAVPRNHPTPQTHSTNQGLLWHCPFAYQGNLRSHRICLTSPWPLCGHGALSLHTTASPQQKRPTISAERPDVASQSSAPPPAVWPLVDLNRC